MFDFKKLVSSILLEQQNNILESLQKILKKHDELDYSNNKFANNDTALNSVYTFVAGKNYVADSDVKNNLSDVRVIDILQRLYDATPDRTTYKSWGDFKNFLSQTYTDATNQRFLDILNDYQKILPSLTLTNKEDWPILHVQVKRAYDNTLKEVASLGERALEADPELSNSSVVEAVQKIVNRRIGVFTRVANLKSPKQPFTNLINDIFKTPELYLSGSKEYSSDFAAIDQLYIQDLIKVAIAAKEFYAAEVTRLKTQSSEQTNLESVIPKLVKNILNELSSADIAAGRRRTYTPPSQQTNRQQNQRTGSISPSIMKQLKDKALQDVRNRMNFLTGIPVQYNIVDSNGRDTNQTGVIDSSKDYNIGGILKLQTPEAQNLIKALGAIALYTKKKPGAGEIISQKVQALSNLGQSIASFGGAKLYGG
jgi:hypothetical protein